MDTNANTRLWSLDGALDGAPDGAPDDTLQSTVVNHCCLFFFFFFFFFFFLATDPAPCHRQRQVADLHQSCFYRTGRYKPSATSTLTGHRLLYSILITTCRSF